MGVQNVNPGPVNAGRWINGSGEVLKVPDDGLRWTEAIFSLIAIKWEQQCSGPAFRCGCAEPEWIWQPL